MTLPPRIDKKIERTATCWLWTASADPLGYGHVYLNGAPRLAHRVVYEFLVAPIDAGLDLDHLCRNPRCVNPAHLEPVTHAENMRRTRKTHCSRGHEYTPGNTYTYQNKRGRECRICQHLRYLRRGTTA